jgi:hypothetical protein
VSADTDGGDAADDHSGVEREGGDSTGDEPSVRNVAR